MSSLLAGDIQKALEFRSGLNIILTVGNVCRMDDGAGPYIASQLAGLCEMAGFGNVWVVDAGQTPENHFDKIVTSNPSYVLFIDAADFGGRPGEIRLIGKSHLSDLSISTHMFPIRAIWELIEAEIPTQIQAIGIQAEDCGFGEGLTEVVRQSADEIVAELKKNIRSLIGSLSDSK
jgi:hydrogenase 3 maturation protease